MLQRRHFLQGALAGPVLAATPVYRVVTPFSKSKAAGMPGPYPGQVVKVHAEKSVGDGTHAIDPAVVRQMISQGMTALTGDRDARDSWSRFFAPKDVVGIKLNCSGAPQIMSRPEVVAEIVQNLTAIGIAPAQIYLYERFPDQVQSVGYPKYLPAGVQIVTAEPTRGSVLGYDPRVYVDVNFFGEDDTRSFMTRVASETVTKIINVPNMKEHQAAGVTGCLKNIAYGSFSNVARSHRSEKTNTLSFIGTLASVEPLPSKVVLNIMDGLKGVWHAGPFSTNERFRFYPKQLLFGTDPVAMDRILIEAIEAKRKQENAPSVFDRSRSRLTNRLSNDPLTNHFIREPGHVEFASHLGLGVYDLEKIRVRAIEL